MVQNPAGEDISARAYFVFGNSFTNGGIFNGMDPAPTFFHVSSVPNNTLAFTNSNTRRYQFNQFDYAWALNVMPGNSPNTYTIAGMQNLMLAGCGTPLSSVDNVNPFLAELTLTPSGPNLAGSANFWSTQLSLAGTGVSTLPNSYHNLGGCLSNYAWNSTYATRQPFGVTTDIVMTAPVWDNTYSKLTYKFIRTDLTGKVVCPTQAYANSCPGQYITLGIDRNVNNFTGTMGIITSNTLPVAVLNAQTVETNISPIQVKDCFGGYFKATPHAAQSLIQPIPLTYTVSPNPASGQVNIVINGANSDQQVIISMSDVTGRSIGTLFSGKYSEFSGNIVLPALSSGIYMLHLRVDDHQLAVQKLSIN